MPNVLTALITAVLIMGGLGLTFATILAVAYRLLRVAEDPRVGAVEGLLPGTNCGACGQPGCAAFAEALVDGGAAPAQCTVSSPAAIEAVAELLGVDAGEVIARVARLHCAGGTDVALQDAAYAGHSTCTAAALVSGGGKSCPWGCLGLADCEVSCTFDAIHMDRFGLPVVDVDKCTACGDCVDACPRDLFEILPLDQPLVVQCAAPLKGEAATAVCAVACDACGRCAADAPEGLVEMVGELPVVHQGTGIEPTRETVSRCPTGAIQWVSGEQFTATHDEPRRIHALRR